MTPAADGQIESNTALSTYLKHLAVVLADNILIHAYFALILER